MNNKKGKLFVFSAPSGTGKTTIIKNVLENFPELSFSISATTRGKRITEKEGVDYYFLSKDEFKKKVENDEFLEWGKFFGYYYGTLNSLVFEKINSGISIVLEVDVKGALNIKKVYPDSVLIFISPPSIEELKLRLINRKTESDEDFKKRIERAEMELDFKEKFDYNVFNYNLDDAQKEVNEIIKSELA
ncbi:MAG: guanylate kinase [Ignavibacteriae bacterium]|nr:guanylate kinase [Ignavibacteriota bacterium]MCB9210392.1 guanylate kinase [Ignavibacteriales bacterium]MCB9219197.1 guanylate kinase [Ignavibacteriales bacterium]MCB9259779.1 guanylate kinase [Ignavibacteriales bacterium]